MRLSLRCLLPAVGLIVAASFVSQAHGGGRPSETILPNTTKAYLSAPNPAAAREAWERTQLGQLVRDPEMKPFVESFRDQLKNKLTETGKKLGVAWTDLEGVPGGEIALAAVANHQGRPANILTVDVTGHGEKAAELLAKVEHSLTTQGAKKSEQTIGGLTANVYDFPRQEGERRTRQAFHVIKDDVLIACDDAQVLGDVLGRWSGEAKDSLAADAAFAHVMQVAAEESKGLAPHFRWFVEPFGLVEMIRSAEVSTAERKRDIFKALKNQGYTAVKGVGGHLNFSAGGYELLHRTAIYAPTPASGERFELAARALEFPNSTQHGPPAWVPREIASYASINVNAAKAFAASKSLVNELANDPKTDKSPGFIDDILEGIAIDPDGPQVHIEKEILANLGDRAIVITDYEYPVTPQCERMLVAVEAKDAETVASAIDRLMAADSTAKQLTINGVKVWMMTEPPPAAAAAPFAPADIVIMGGDGFVQVEEEGDAAPKEDKPVADRFRAPNSAWAVAHGHLFHTSHVELLRKVLEKNDAEKSLADAADHQTVLAEMEKLGAGENSFRLFGRTDEQTRPTYELLRAGKMPEAETLLGRILNRLLEEPRALEPRKQKLDGSQLPSYDMVRRYLGPAGTFVTSRDDGWLITGFSLPKRAPVEIGMATEK
ncbi:MAG: hypothetical protein DCC68_23825 [Planctomycetota bacterium]|nr:MAG: hypothetical protein DCC68_23825 [Planctomycetota bacterium]